jgi:hypothetical protein
MSGPSRKPSQANRINELAQNKGNVAYTKSLESKEVLREKKAIKRQTKVSAKKKKA